MTDKPMSVMAAVEVLKEFARPAVEHTIPEPTDYVRMKEALATLDGLHIYGSKFKVGDEVWPINKPGKIWGVVRTNTGMCVDSFANGDILMDDGQGGRCFPASDCFPTREEAEVECERRNQK